MLVPLKQHDCQHCKASWVKHLTAHLIAALLSCCCRQHLLEGLRLQQRNCCQPHRPQLLLLLLLLPVPGVPVGCAPVPAVGHQKCPSTELAAAAVLPGQLLAQQQQHLPAQLCPYPLLLLLLLLLMLVLLLLLLLLLVLLLLLLLPVTLMPPGLLWLPCA
jgi:hypothetical protein